MSKRMKNVADLFAKEQCYGLDEFFGVLDKYRSSCSAKFDESVDVVIKFGLDMNKQDSLIKTFVDLPNGNGRENKVVVFANDVSEKELLDAGAFVAGGDELIAKVASGEISDFDKCVATTGMMPKLAKIAKILGPKGLMPSTKTGTVVSSAEAVKTVSLLVKGRSVLKIDKDATAKISIGRISFDKSKITQNLAEVLSVVKQVKPSSVKGNYIQCIYIGTTMGASMKVKVSDVAAL